MPKIFLVLYCSTTTLLYMSLSNLKIVNFELLHSITTIRDTQKKQDIITSLLTYHTCEYSTIRSIVLFRNVLFRDRVITSGRS